MSEKPTQEQHSQSRDTGNDVADGLTELVAKTLELGVSMARIVAEATSGGKGVQPPRTQTPINAIVHYGVISVVNVISTVTKSISETARTAESSLADTQATRQDKTPDQTPQTASKRPTVHQGASLRIPLSIENPKNTALTDMFFICSKIELLDAYDEGDGFSKDWVRFEPDTLSIAPNDFEKLTVFVDVPDTGQTGLYRMTIGLTDNTPVAIIDFVVVEAYIES